MHRTVLVAALLAILLTAAPALAQAPSAPADVPIGGVSEDGFIRTSSDTFVSCSPGVPELRRYAQACAEAGFPILDAQTPGASVPAATPTEPAAAQAPSVGGGPISGGGASVDTTLPDTGGPVLLIVAGLLLAGVAGLVARHRSTR